MTIFITTGYGKNIIGGADIWCNNFVENVLPLVTDEYKLIIDGRPLLTEPTAIYTYNNDIEIDRILSECDKIVFLHSAYKENPIIKKWLHKTDTTFVHAFIPDMLGLKSEYENIMTKLDWEWQRSILDNSKNIIWIGYEGDTIHKLYRNTKTITNYYQFKRNIQFNGIQNKQIGFASRCETRKNADFLDGLPSFIFSNKYDYRRMVEGSGINTELHTFLEFDYRYHNKFFDKDFQIFHGCYTKEPFGYAIFDAVDSGKLPILHSDWMSDIDYRYRASNKNEFNHQYIRMIEDNDETTKSEFTHLKSNLAVYTNKHKWVTEICNYLTIN